jgi:aurora kinase, other
LSSHIHHFFVLCVRILRQNTSDKENRCPNGDDLKLVPKNVVLPVKKSPCCIDDFDIGKYVGGGSFGKVFAARKKDDTNHHVALKVIRKGKDTRLIDIQRETNIQSFLHIRHRNILGFYDYFCDGSNLVLVLEYCKESLGSAISNERLGRLGEVRSVHILLQLVDALHFCHKHRVIHRDVKPENIMLGANDLVKLGDFGLATFHPMFNVPYEHDYCGTMLFMAPELTADKPYDERVDHWAVGVSLFEMLVGKLPFLSEKSILNAEFYCNFDFVDLLAQELIAQFLVVDPSKRIKLNRVPKHQWVRQVLRKA